MKKHLFVCFLAAAVGLSSCKKDKGSEDGNPDGGFQLGYSNLTVEEHKKELEQAGLSFVQEFNTLPEEDAFKVISYLADLGPVFGENIGIASVFAISNHATDKNIAGLLASVNSDETVKISDEFARYVWNFGTQDWDKADSYDKLIYEFPSDASKTTNDATLTVSYTPGSTVTIDGEKVELPKNTTTVLKLGTKELLTLTTSHEYKADGTPTKTVTNLTIGAFGFATDITNNGTTVNSSVSLKKNQKQLFAVSLGGEASVTVTDINNDADIENLIKNANASLEIMQYKFTGNLNINALNNELNTLPDNYSAQTEAALWNKHTQLYVINTKDNGVVAKAEFVGEDIDYGCVLGQCSLSSSIEPVLVFKDGSKQSIESFTEGRFTEVIDELEAISNKF